MGGAWPAVPQIEDATPAKQRRAWGKVAHEDRFRDQRRQLLRAAAKLASRKGYQATHVSDIVSEAGLSKTTFYEHFKSKEDCFVELHRRVSSAMLRAGISAAEDAIEKGPFETVLAVIRAMTGYVAQDPRLADVLRDEVSASHSAIVQERKENQKHTIELFITLAQRFGSALPKEELEISSIVLVQGVIAVLPQLRKRAAGFDENLRSIARLACRGMGLEAT
ncbi:MAG TPA: TetR/AcrR family transcriptional regulator [Actinomycetota bacterium]|nr:TetR/AcrR family transcriptional regulator [Actinomycetota bacterium]